MIGEGVVGEQLAAEPGHDPGECRADLPCADNADSLAHQVETGKTVQAEVTLAGAVVGTVQAAVECEDQRYGVFGDRMGELSGYPYDRQAQALGDGEVDMVVTRRAQCNQSGAALCQVFQHRGAEVVVDRGADHLVVFGQGHGVEIESGRLELQFQPSGSGSPRNYRGRRSGC